MALKLIEIKSRREIDKMRQAGRIVATVLQEVSCLVEPGWTTADIDLYAARRVKELGAIASFKGYMGFPAHTCVSVNNEVVHGIPNSKKVIKAGDVVKIDFGAIYDGWHGDSTLTVGIPPLKPKHQQLIDVACEALNRGIASVKAGIYLQEISGVIQDYVEAHGFSVVRQYVGHGVGRNMHEEPQVPNYRTRDLPNPRLKAGMVLAIEPMVNIGGHTTRVLADRWTVVTVDNSWSAQFEHTVLVTETGFEVLTDRSQVA
ncbi:MAG: type I methionyl aminopeptidase [Synechococcales cyanobacterium]